MESNSEFMIVRIRFGRPPALSAREASHRSGKRSRIAALAASLMTLVAISLASLGMWGIAADLDWAGAFVISTGFFSHWQVWIGAAAFLKYAAWRLRGYARAVRSREMEASHEESSRSIGVPANV